MQWLDTLVGGTRARILRLLRRSRSTIADLAEAVGISGNAVRGHVSSLQADGLVDPAGTAPSTGGKPAHLYDLSRRGEELFPKAYAPVLIELVRTLEERDGREPTLELLRRVGARAARGIELRGDSVDARVEAAADALRSLGGDVTVARGPGRWEIRGFGCPLAAVVLDEPDTCQLARGLVAHVTGMPVRECCDRSGTRARCAFHVSEGSPSDRSDARNG